MLNIALGEGGGVQEGVPHCKKGDESLGKGE